MLTDTHFSWLAIFLAAIANMVLGMIWYHPKIFGHLWASHLNINKEDLKPNFQVIGMEFLLGLLSAFVLALLIDWTASLTSWEGALLGFWVALGFVATTIYSQVLWSKKPPKNFLIEAAFSLISFMIMGGIIGAFTD